MFPQLALAVLLAADLTGTWSGHLTPAIEVAVTLQQHGDSISGTEALADHVFPIENAKTENNKLTFTIPAPVGGRLRHIPVTATLQNDELHLQESGQDIVLKHITPNKESARVERLAAVIRLWGAIRYFHPYVAYRPIDWDTALVAAIAPVENAATADDFTRAVSAMLSVLSDTETQILSPNEPEPPSIACQCREIVRSGFFDDAAAVPGEYYVDWENVATRASYVMHLPDGIRVAIRTAEPVSAITGIRTRDNPYPVDLPSRELRLLALARYWNVIHYFYGYPESLAAWDSTLPEFIPEFEKVQSRHDYLFTVGRLAARTNDGHSFLGAGTGTILSEFGSQPRVALLRNIGGQIVVTASATPNLRNGDVITTINGQPALNREAFLTTLFPHSTPQSGTVIADRFLLAAGPDTQVKLGVRRFDGAEQTIALNPYGADAPANPVPPVPGTYGRLPSGLGYMDLTRLEETDVDSAFDSLMDAPGLILDLRGYPRGRSFVLIAARLTDHPVPAALTRHRIWHGPDPAAVTEDIYVQEALPSGKPAYRGRVAVLIDGGSFSLSEHTGLLIEASAKTIFVGTPTSGTDGTVTSMMLPGRLEAHFSGINVRHADGRPLQRVGILPDVRVAPTVKGIQEGRDEILDAAIQALR